MSGETEKSVSGWTVDTLKELHDRELAHERAMREAERRAAEVALLLQQSENARHFAALNGEQARIANVLATTIPREVFEQYRDEREKADRLVAAQLSEERGARAQTARWMAVALFVIAVVSFLLRFLPAPQ